MKRLGEIIRQKTPQEKKYIVTNVHCRECINLFRLCLILYGIRFGLCLRPPNLQCALKFSLSFGNQCWISTRIFKAACLSSESTLLIKVKISQIYTFCNEKEFNCSFCIKLWSSRGDKSWKSVPALAWLLKHSCHRKCMSGLKKWWSVG